MDPLALFPLDEECLCELLFDIEEDRVEELVVEDDPVEAREVGPEGVIELLPLILFVGLGAIGAGLLLDGNEEDGVCDGRPCGNPGIGWRSLPGALFGFGDT